MKLYMKQQVFALKDRFFVKDDSGADCYLVEGEFLSLGKKLHIKDTAGRELALVQQKLLSLLPRYTVSIEDEEVAEIFKEFTLFKPSYKVRGPGWTVDGDIWDHDYKIRRGMDVVAHVSKAWLSWGDSYVIDIRRDINPLMVLAVVLAIDCVLDAEGDAAAAANNNG